MGLPNYFELTGEHAIVQGKTWRFWFAVQYPDGEVVDLPAEGYTTARMQVRSDYDQAVVFDLTTENGGIVLGLMSDGDPVAPMDWSGYLYLPASTTAAAQPFGLGKYDLEAYHESSPDEVLDILKGPAVLVQEVTK